MNSIIANRLKFFPLLLLLAATTASCGGGGGGGSAAVVPPPAYGALDGYVFVPIGSGARQAGAAPAGYKPVSGAHISASCGSASKSADTDSAGHYTITSLPAGSCSLTISKSGYAAYTISASVSANQTTTVGGSSGSALSPSSSGSIKVTANISGGKVSIDGYDTNITIPSTLSYTFSNISPGAHSVSIARSGFDALSPASATVTAGATAYVSFTLNLTGNRAPVANAGPDAKWFAGTKYENDRAQSLIENRNVFNPVPISYQLDGGGSSDLDANALTYRWAQTSGPAVSLSDSTASKPTFIPNTPGVYIFALSVSDGYLRSATDTVTVNIQKLSGKITYSAPNGTDEDLYIVNFDAATENGWKQITNNNYDDSDPSWSPDGMKIAYGCSPTNNVGDICIVNSDGAGYKNLTNNSSGTITSPDWYDNTMLLFGKGPNKVYDVFSVNKDGTGLTNKYSSQQSVFGLKYSNDSSKILFISDYGNDNYEVMSMDSSGSNVKRLTNNTTTELSAVWMPDGRILYTSGASLSASPNHLYVMNSDGTGRQEIPLPVGLSFILGRPTVSTDGKFIFIEGQNSYIYVLYADGSAACNLGFWGSNPDYHPGP